MAGNDSSASQGHGQGRGQDHRQHQAQHHPQHPQLHPGSSSNGSNLPHQHPHQHPVQHQQHQQPLHVQPANPDSLPHLLGLMASVPFAADTPTRSLSLLLPPFQPAARHEQLYTQLHQLPPLQPLHHQQLFPAIAPLLSSVQHNHIQWRDAGQMLSAQPSYIHQQPPPSAYLDMQQHQSYQQQQQQQQHAQYDPAFAHCMRLDARDHVAYSGSSLGLASRPSPRDVLSGWIRESANHQLLLQQQQQQRHQAQQQQHQQHQQPVLSAINFYSASAEPVKPAPTAAPLEPLQSSQPLETQAPVKLKLKKPKVDASNSQQQQQKQSQSHGSSSLPSSSAAPQETSNVAHVSSSAPLPVAAKASEPPKAPKRATLIQVPSAASIPTPVSAPATATVAVPAPVSVPKPLKSSTDSSDPVRKAANLITSILDEAERAKETSMDTGADGFSIARPATIPYAKLLRHLSRALPLRFHDLVACMSDDGSTEEGESQLLRLIDLAETTVRLSDHAGLFRTSAQTGTVSMTSSPQRNLNRANASAADASSSQEPSAFVWAVPGIHDGDDFAAMEESVAGHLQAMRASIDAARVALLLGMAEAVSESSTATTAESTDGANAGMATATRALGMSGQHRGKLCREGLLTSVLGLLKTQLSATVLQAILLANAGDEKQTVHIQDQQAVLRQPRVKHALVELTSGICDCIGHLAGIASHSNLSEQAIITLVYILVPLFFTESSSFDAELGIGTVLVQAMRLLVVLFAKHSSHRHFILEEIMTSFSKICSLGKKSHRVFRLPNAHSIHLVSALLLELVQGCGSRFDPALVAAAKSDAVLLHADAADQKGEPSDEEQAAMTAVDKAVQQSKEIVDSANQALSFVVKYLLGRCAGSAEQQLDPMLKADTRRRTGTTESEFRVVLDIFLKDLLSLVGVPEWPAAETMAQKTTQIMMNTFDDSVKHGHDMTVVRLIALEWLGGYGAKATRLGLDWVSAFGPSSGFKEMPSHNMNKGDAQLMCRLQDQLLRWLQESNGSAEGHTLKSMLGFAVAKWAAGLPFAFQIPDSQEHRPRLATLAEMVVATHASRLSARAFSAAASGDSLTSMSRSDVESLANGLMCSQLLVALRDTVLQCICRGVASDSVALRTRALKSLQEVLVVDPSLVLATSIRRVIGDRLLDSSPLVRDAAVDLLGKYVLSGGRDVLGEYYPVLCDRIMDVSPSVRKRVLRLFREMYVSLSVGQSAPKPTATSAKDAVDAQSMAVDIASRILGRLHDDPSVADLAVKVLSELWLQPAKDHNDYASVREWQSLPEDDKAALRTTVTILTRVLAKSAVSAALFGELLSSVVKQAGKAAKAGMLGQVHCMVLCLMDQLLTLYGQSQLDAISANLGLLLRLCDIAPDLVSPHLLTLHPFIRPSQAASDPAVAQQEQQIVQNVLAIFRNVLPMIKDADAALVGAVETDLLQLLNKSPQTIIQSAVPCICIIVANHTHHSAKLARVVTTCYGVLDKTKAQYAKTKTLPANALRTIWRCLILLTLVLRHYDFSTERDDAGVYSLPEIQAIADGKPITDRAYDMVLFYLLQVTASPDTNLIALACLGNLLLLQPTLFLRDESMRAVARVFAPSGTAKEKRQLLAVFVEYLEREQSVKADRAVLSLSDAGGEGARDKARVKSEGAGSQAIDLKLLVGNADEISEAGIAGSVMQRFLADILACMLSGDVQLTQAAFQVIELVVEQGLIHPILAVPALCAIESSDNAVMATRAFAMHQRLADKHASFIHTKNMEAVRCIYDYHVRLSALSSTAAGKRAVGYLTVTARSEGGAVTVQHEARISKIYSLIRSARNKRNDFLRSLVRLFETDRKKSASPEDALFLFFIADNLAVLDYKTVDEVLIVVFSLNRILSVVSETVFDQIKSLGNPNGPADTPGGLGGLTYRAMGLGIMSALKYRLQQTYQLSDARCNAYQPASVTSKTTEKPAVTGISGVHPVDWQQLVPGGVFEWPTEESQVALCRHVAAIATQLIGHIMDETVATAAAVAGSLESARTDRARSVSVPQSQSQSQSVPMDWQAAGSQDVAHGLPTPTPAHIQSSVSQTPSSSSSANARRTSMAASKTGRLATGLAHMPITPQAESAAEMDDLTRPTNRSAPAPAASGPPTPLGTAASTVPPLPPVRRSSKRPSMSSLQHDPLTSTGPGGSTTAQPAPTTASSTKKKRRMTTTT
ncbi:hypothetical protein BC831DRAFT_413959 [Entophlyctis helioformis]|nr:hypothetical protein BC831DRAFT_413959 [Entophlyctis helioformis]